MTEAWRADLDLALQALHAVERLAEQGSSDETQPAADPLMGTLFALEASRTARKHVNKLISALAGHAMSHGANWQVLGYSYDAFDE